VKGEGETEKGKGKGEQGKGEQGKERKGKDDCWSLGGSTPVIVADECLYIFGNCSLPISSNSTTLKSCR